jgi:hypothetical protein
VSTVSGKEPARSRLPCHGFNHYLGEVIGTPSQCKSRKQILNMHEFGVTSRPFEGKRRKAASLIRCPIEPHFQDIRGVGHVSAAEAVLFGLSSLPPLFLTGSNIGPRDPELCTVPGDLQPSM